MKTLFNYIVCEKYHNNRTVPLYNTAGKIIRNRGDIFCLSGSKQIDDIKILCVSDSDDYLSAIHKTLNSMIYHYDNKTQFDFFFMCDDDTYINFKNYDAFLEIIKNRNSNEIYGCTGSINGDGRIHATGGPGWVMNRKTFDLIVPHIKKCYITHEVHSDVSVALNVHDYNDKNQNKIQFIEVPEFLHPHKPMTDLNKIITFHIMDKFSYQMLYENCINIK